MIVNDSNDIETATFYKIKLRSDVEIWQLFHKYSEVINARWPSAQWVDDSVFEQERWGHGYYNYSDVKGTIKEYSNGEIVDIPTNNINLYEFINKQKTIEPLFDVNNSLINLNVGSFKTYTREVLTHNGNTFTYDPVDLWKTKHHDYFLEKKIEFLDSENEWFYAVSYTHLTLPTKA